MRVICCLYFTKGALLGITICYFLCPFSVTSWWKVLKLYLCQDRLINWDDNIHWGACSCSCMCWKEKLWSPVLSDWPLLQMFTILGCGFNELPGFMANKFLSFQCRLGGSKKFKYSLQNRLICGLWTVKCVVLVLFGVLYCAANCYLYDVLSCMYFNKMMLIKNKIKPPARTRFLVN